MSSTVRVGGGVSEEVGLVSGDAVGVMDGNGVHISVCVGVRVSVKLKEGVGVGGVSRVGVDESLGLGLSETVSVIWCGEEDGDNVSVKVDVGEFIELGVCVFIHVGVSVKVGISRVKGVCSVSVGVEVSTSVAVLVGVFASAVSVLRVLARAASNVRSDAVVQADKNNSKAIRIRLVSNRVPSPRGNHRPRQKRRLSRDCHVPYFQSSVVKVLSARLQTPYRDHPR